jgi:hypothetical protein
MRCHPCLRSCFLYISPHCSIRALQYIFYNITDLSILYGNSRVKLHPTIKRSYSYRLSFPSRLTAFHFLSCCCIYRQPRIPIYTFNALDVSVPSTNSLSSSALSPPFSYPKRQFSKQWAAYNHQILTGFGSSTSGGITATDRRPGHVYVVRTGTGRSSFRTSNAGNIASPTI